MNAARRNTGNTLFIVIVLLLLASMMSLFAMNVGVFEQRASGSDLRAKLVNEVAEAGLAQGMEYLRQNSAQLKNASGGSWEKCTATDTTFPCGSIVDARRETMYRWVAGGHDFDESGGISGWEGRMLPITN
ncbi:MAG: hypothetical protein M3Q40_04895, partial [Pseudomonadota bacterium]|nr:hypothetical protein [Pseudomonadota bacterium]